MHEHICVMGMTVFVEIRHWCGCDLQATKCWCYLLAAPSSAQILFYIFWSLKRWWLHILQMVSELSRPHQQEVPLLSSAFIWLRPRGGRLGWSMAIRHKDWQSGSSWAVKLQTSETRCGKHPWFPSPCAVWLFECICNSVLKTQPLVATQWHCVLDVEVSAYSHFLYQCEL